MSDSVRSIDRCFDILEMLLDSGGDMSLAEISRKLGAPKSTVHTIVRTLTARGLLALDDERKSYRLGLGFVRFAGHGRQPVSLEDIARPHLEKLTHATGETSTLAMVEGHSVFYSCAVQGPQLIRYVVPVGVPRPLHCTASGKLALAQMDQAAVKTYVRNTRLTRQTARTITQAKSLAIELDKIRKQGVSTSLGEISTDLFGVAAPIRDHDGRMIASVNLAGPIFRLGNRMPKLTQAVQQAAQAISQQVRQVGSSLVLGRADAGSVGGSAPNPP
jgi:DNA-binding IclR family transcriptional regulator